MGSIVCETPFDQEQTAPTFVGSLEVPNVQEIVRDNSSSVPQIYVRDQCDMPKATEITHLSTDIPVIDLSLLSDDNIEELERLDQACRDWGFFQVINHGVPSEVLQNMKQNAEGFFNLSLEEKNKFSMPPDDIQGYGHAYVVSKEQKLDWSDALVLVTMPQEFRNLQYWPTTPVGFKDIIDTYSKGLATIGEQLLSSISLNMGLQRNTLLQEHKGISQALRINYYPPCSKPDQVLGISPHSDTSSITILLQEDHLHGLQIHHNDDWIPVEPIPDALVINIGDVIEIWSNGKYKSIEHRAVTNECKARMSLAAFLFPNLDKEIEPFDSMVKSQDMIKNYKKVKYGDYLLNSMKRKLEGKTHTEMAKN
ncbi:protein LATERAL BRANCHING OXIDOREDUCTASE 1-like [Apium graveolens]|uniref:protein LATERAL BRANCHING OXIDOREDUCTASE 1-like n=1 Tax=Apium graveolens TaxID=4045 RepID=UPI003D7AA61B